MKRIKQFFEKEDYLTAPEFILALIRKNSKLEHAILRYIFGMETFMLIMGLMQFNLARPRAWIYLGLYASLALAAIGSDLAFCYGEKKGDRASLLMVRNVGYFFYLFIHVWAMTLTTMDVVRGGSYWTAASAMVATGIFIVLVPVYSIGITVLCIIYLCGLYIATEGFGMGMINIILFGLVVCIIHCRMYIGAYNTMYAEDKLRDISRRDGLTSVLNRRALNQKLEALEGCFTGSVAIIDLDNFKRINDTEGHQNGDEALLLVTSFLRDAFKDEELYRYGGDEFLILTELSPKQTAEKLNRIGDRLRCTEREIKIGLSGGVVASSPEKTMEDTIRLADQLLYQVKENGKGEVIF